MKAIMDPAGVNEAVDIVVPGLCVCVCVCVRRLIGVIISVDRFTPGFAA